MSEPVTIVIPGTPRPKGRPRVNTKTNTVYTPAGTKQYEMTVARLAAIEMQRRAPMTGPLHLDMKAHFPIPINWPQSKREQALLGALKPTGKPDLDNIIKAIADGMQKIVYGDDAAIVSVNCSKVYGAGEPFVVVTIRPVIHRVPETITSAVRDEHSALRSEPLAT